MSLRRSWLFGQAWTPQGELTLLRHGRDHPGHGAEEPLQRGQRDNGVQHGDPAIESAQLLFADCSTAPE